MKKLFKGLISLLFVAIVLFAAFLFANSATPSVQLKSSQQVQEIMANGGCISCHTENPVLPFYAKYPVAGSIIRKDITDGWKQFDVTAVTEALNKGGAVPEADLAKLEDMIEDCNMPPLQYAVVHWGSYINSAERNMFLNWINEQHITYYTSTHTAADFAMEPNQPIPDSVAVDIRKVALGDSLFNDTRLSSDNTVSCASCHALNTGGVDNKVFSEGVHAQLGGVNDPTVFNANFNFVQFWDGRAATLADQAAGPPLNPKEMASESFDQIIAKLAEDKIFTDSFLAVYPEGYSQATITNAIQEFEKTLITPNSRFDRYLKGDRTALNQTEINGYELFKENKCATCHVGINFGGQSYERLGLVADYFKDRGTPLTEDDKGRFKQTAKERDMHRYKVPGLRNIALTFPYFHDGSKKTMDEAVEAMIKYQIGTPLTQEEQSSVVAFLGTLTGEYKGVLLTNDNSLKKN